MPARPDQLFSRALICYAIATKHSVCCLPHRFNNNLISSGRTHSSYLPTFCIRKYFGESKLPNVRVEASAVAVIASFVLVAAMSWSSVLFTYVVPALLAVYLLIKWKFSYWKNRGVLSTRPRTILGDMVDVGFKYHMVIKVQKLYEESKAKSRYLGMYSFGTPTLLLTDLDLVKTVLVKDFHYFSDRALYLNERDDPAAASLLTLDSEKWKRHRHLLTPALTTGRIKHMFGTISNTGTHLIEYFNDFISNGEPMNARDMAARFTADVIGSCAFGLDCKALKTKDTTFINFSKEAFGSSAFSLVYILFISSFQDTARKLRCKLFNTKMTNFFKKVLLEAIEYRKEHEVRNNDFLDMMIQLMERGTVNEDAPVNEANRFTFDEVWGESVVFFIAGFDTM